MNKYIRKFRNKTYQIKSIKTKLRISNPLSYLIKHLIPKSSKSITHIRHLLLHNLFQKRGKFWQSCVIHVIEPTFYENSVVWLQLKVFGHIVYNYSFWEISSDSTQVLHEHWSVRQSVLSVQSVLYSFLFIDLVEYPIGILLLNMIMKNNVYLHPTWLPWK